MEDLTPCNPSLDGEADTPARDDSASDDFFRRPLPDLRSDRGSIRWGSAVPCVKRDIPVDRGTSTGIYSAPNGRGGAGIFRLTSGVVPLDTFSNSEALTLSCGAAAVSCEALASSSPGCACAVPASSCAASVCLFTGALRAFLAPVVCADFLSDEPLARVFRCSAEPDASGLDPETCGFGRRNEGRGAPLTSDDLCDRDRADPAARLRPAFFFLTEPAPVIPDVPEGIVRASATRRATAGARPTCRKDGVSLSRVELCDAEVRRRALTGVEVRKTEKCASAPVRSSLRLSRRRTSPRPCRSPLLPGRPVSSAAPS